MRTISRFLLVPAIALAAACGKEDRATSTQNEMLSRDLALAASAQPYGQQFVSPQELGYAPQQYGQFGYGVPQGYPHAQPVPVVYRYPAPVAQRTTAPRSSGTIYRAPAPREPVRHTKRDAMIGATAGAIAGAAIGRDVKGAVIGAAAGGILGAVVGHTIDVERP